MAHIQELRRRAFYVAGSVFLFGVGAYNMQTTLTNWLLAPAKGQKFIYTTPGGGFDFQFRICLYAGIAASIPVVVYQIFRYLQPLVRQQTRRFWVACWFWSSILAVLGIMFGYFVGLPSALNFLLKNFSTSQISALISIQSYLAFVTTYLLAAALLFQIPLILLLINRFKPLSPRKLMKYQRWVILVSFIMGAILSPTPDIRNQLLLSLPILGMYELSMGLISYVNWRRRKPRRVVQLLAKDQERQVERQAKFEQALAARRTGQATQSTPIMATARPQIKPQLTPITDTRPGGSAATPATPTPRGPTIESPALRPVAAQSDRPRRYLQDFTRPSYGFSRQQPSQQ